VERVLAPTSTEPGHPSGAPKPLILFDGVCNLCNAVVTWVIERDRRGEFRFAALQSGEARRALAAAGAPDARTSTGPEHALGPDSVVLIDGAGVHTRSEAALHIARALGPPWSLLGFGRVIPRRLRDGLYDFIAGHRYRWFGKRDACVIPPAKIRARFTDHRGADRDGADEG